MRELRTIRQIELAAVVLTVIIRVTLGLYMEYMHFQSIQAFDFNSQFTTLSSYTFFLNTIFPVIARAIFLTVAWYVFHYIFYPSLKVQDLEEKSLIYLSIVLVCTVAGIFLYYYFKLTLISTINFNVVTEIQAQSLYRNQTVFTDSVGMFIMIGWYELLAQAYYFVHRQLMQEREWIYSLVRISLLVGLAFLLILFVSITDFPNHLWERPLHRFLLLAGMGLQVFVMQQYVYQQILPSIQTQQFTRFFIHISVHVLLTIAGTFVIWRCYTHFTGPFVEAVFISSVLSLLSSGIIAYIRQSLLREKSKLQTQVSATAAELSSLRSQINPHFLFNALNSLYATALKENSDKTADGIQKLGDMMRFMLEENNQERIPLDKEIEYLHNYIEIQRMRIDESQGVEIRINIQQPEKEIFIAPMMLNPFVENAFKHGVSLQYPSWIYITLTLDAARLYFKVHNSLHKKAADDPEKSYTGVGLANVKKRLELLYPGKHTLDIQQSDKDFFVALTLTYG